MGLSTILRFPFFHRRAIMETIFMKARGAEGKRGKGRKLVRTFPPFFFHFSIRKLPPPPFSPKLSLVLLFPNCFLYLRWSPRSVGRHFIFYGFLPFARSFLGLRPDGNKRIEIPGLRVKTTEASKTPIYLFSLSSKKIHTGRQRNNFS